MKIDLYQVDAFANKKFEGNPAAVCPLNEWLPDSLMQAIAAENNLSETAFFVKEENDYHIRWFTPTDEVNLCGHATLASAYVLFNVLGIADTDIVFNSRSGPLPVSRIDEQIVLNFPSQAPQSCAMPSRLSDMLGVTPLECLQHEDLLVVLENENRVRDLDPDFESLKSLDFRGVIVTAAAAEYDFVARFFAPKVGINEDPVTGSAYTKLVPYWAQKTGKNRFHARQVSERGGELRCELKDDRVLIGGTAVLYLKGEIEI